MADDTLPERQWIIYALLDPRDGRIRYVGWTVNPKTRLRDHLKPTELARGTHKTRWLSKLVEMGLRPSMLTIESGVGSGWQAAEARWIVHFRDLGCDLTNATEGGDGAPGRTHSKKSRAAMSAKRKGIVPTKAIEASLLARKQNGHAISEKGRAAISAANKGKPKPQHVKDAVSRGNKGRVHSSETRAKLSAMRRGKPGKKMSEQQKQKLRTERKGKPQPQVKAYWDSLSPEERTERQKQGRWKHRNVVS